MSYIDCEKSGVEVFSKTLNVPICSNGDNIADIWKTAANQEWRNQYGKVTPTNADFSFFKAGDDPELQSPDALRKTLKHTLPDGTTVPVQHLTTGDAKTVAMEYRGYILDGGGFDWDGNGGFAGGHKRLSPAFKEILVDTIWMAGLPAVPNRAAVVSIADTVAKGMSQRVDGAGVRMYYIVSSNALINKVFTTAGTQLNNEMNSYIFLNSDRVSPTGESLTGFKSLLFADSSSSFAERNTNGASDTSAANGFAYIFVANCANGAGFYGTPIQTYISCVVAHELHHLQINQNGTGSASPNGDGQEHFNDPNGNGIQFDPDDIFRVLWNYHFKFPTALLDGAIDANATSITLKNISGPIYLPGRLIFDGPNGSNEIVFFTGINGNTLTGCVRHDFGSDASNEPDGAPVTFQDTGRYRTVIKYGAGTTKYIDIK